jgi:hypothetical protein
MTEQQPYPVFEPTDDPDEWRARKQQPARLHLSCGLIVYARPASLLRLMRQGKIPLTLAGRVEALINGESLRLDVQRLDDSLPVIDAVVAAVVERPPVVRELKEGQELPNGAVHIEEIDETDRIEILRWALEGVAPFAVFPGAGPPRGNGDRPAGGALQPEAEQPAEG